MFKLTHKKKENPFLTTQNIFTRWGLSLNSDNEIILLEDNEPLPNGVFTKFCQAETSRKKALISLTYKALAGYENTLQRKFVRSETSAGGKQKSVSLKGEVLLERISISLPILPSSIQNHLMNKAEELTKQNFPVREKDVINLLKKVTSWKGGKENLHYVKCDFFNSRSTADKTIAQIYLQEVFPDFKSLDNNTIIIKLPSVFLTKEALNNLATVFGLLIYGKGHIIEIQNDSEKTDEFFETLATLAVTNDFDFAYATTKDLMQVT